MPVGGVILNSLMNERIDDPLAVNLLRMSLDHSGVFVWARSQPHIGFHLGHGTAFLIDCGSGPFLVTAAHVYRMFQRDIQISSETIEVQFSDVSFDPTASLISVNDEYDLATFKLTDEQILHCGKSVITGSQRTWPPPKPKVPQAVFVTGYPGCDSYEAGPSAYDFAVYSAILKTKSVGERNIVLHIDASELEDYAGLGLPPPGYDMGGMSGAPLFALVESSVMTWHLCGVIYESNQSLDLVMATCADLLNADGSIG